MRNYFKNLSGLKIAVYFIALLAFIIAIQFIPVQTEAGVDGGFFIEIGPIDIDLANLVDVNGNPVIPVQPPPAITSTGGSLAEWCWSGTCYTGTDQEALDFVTYYLGLIVGEFGTVTGSTVMYDDAGRVIYIACVNGGVVNVTYSDPTGTNDLCPSDPGTQTSLSECSCTPINSCADTTCNTTTCYNGCTTVTGIMDCSVAQDANLGALPVTINSGDTSMLSYSCNPAAPASILPSVGALNGGAPVTSNSVPVSPLTSTTYTLTCFGSTNATSPATVTINAACVPFSGQPCNPVNICGMTNSGTYDCAGVCSVAAPADAMCPVNTNPNAPTITGPVSANNGVTSVFTLSATDVDGDAINYQVDWNNDGIFDETTPIVASGVSQNVNHSWSTDGTYTFVVKTVDAALAESAFTSHAVVISSPPTVSLQAQVNINPPSGADKIMNPGDTLTFIWTTSNAVSCTGSPIGFNTGGASNSAGVSVTPPAPGSSLTYTISCSGPGGTISEDIIVTTNGNPNLTTSVTFDTSASTVDPVTGNYNSTEVRIQIANVGASTAGASAYRLQINYADGTSVDQTPPLAAIASGGSINISRIFSNVPFGAISITVTADPNNVVTEANEGDNVGTYTGALAAQKPLNFDITATPVVVREGQSARISWNTEATYSMNCTVSGPTISPAYTFNPFVNGPTGNLDTGALSSKSEYLLSCTEPFTSTTFTETVAVDVISSAEEI